ncbi:MAG: hypothetical protein R3A50_16895 [Saprospiraceae bacterium]|nr:hypothetical protein [Lewinellaceae bacterium]
MQIKRHLLRGALLICFAILFLSRVAGQTSFDFSLRIGAPDSSEYASSLICDENDDIYLASIVFHRINRQSRCKLFKISKNGKVLWSKL